MYRCYFAQQINRGFDLDQILASDRFWRRFETMAAGAPSRNDAERELLLKLLAEEEATSVEERHSKAALICIKEPQIK
jgi:hypothetical protein